MVSPEAYHELKVASYALCVGIGGDERHDNMTFMKGSMHIYAIIRGVKGFRGSIEHERRERSLRLLHKFTGLS